jgi:uncharacterized membrane protein
MSDFRRVCEVAAVAGVVMLFAAGLWGYVTLPGSIPVKFDLSGHAVEWGSKWTIMILPLLGAAVIIGAWFSVKLGLPPNLPFLGKQNRARVRAINSEMLAVLPLVLVVGFTLMEIETVLGAKSGMLASAYLPTVGALIVASFGCVGFYFARMYRAAQR